MGKKYLASFLICFGFFFYHFKEYKFVCNEVKKDWGIIDISLQEGWVEKNGKVIKGSPYSLIVNFKFNSKKWKKVRLKKVKIIEKNGEIRNVNFLEMEDNVRMFEERIVAGFDKYPFETSYEDKKIIVNFELISDDETVEDSVEVELKVKKRKGIGFPFIDGINGV